MHDTTDWNLLARYFAAECTAEEAAELERWLAADPARGREAELLRRAWERAGELPEEARVGAMWDRLSQTLGAPAAPGAAHGARLLARGGTGGREGARVLSLVQPAPKRPVRRTTWLLATAASLFIAVGGVAAWQFALSQKTATVASAGSPMREFRTARGQRATVVLLDGTRVVLGVDSRLRVAPLESGRRDIYLDGEAVFDVADDETRPFVVHAGTAVMRDLGTTFSVRAYPAEPVRVVVASGLVAIRDTSRPAAREALLSAGDAGWLHEDGSTEIERGIDPSPYMAWTEGRLVFRRAPLGEVVVQLQRWFDVQIAVKDSALLQATVNASFDGDKLDDALQLLAGSLDARVERRGRTATFRENR